MSSLKRILDTAANGKAVLEMGGASMQGILWLYSIVVRMTQSIFLIKIIPVSKQQVLKAM